jgi:hypothetical protein
MTRKTETPITPTIVFDIEEDSLAVVSWLTFYSIGDLISVEAGSDKPKFIFR